MKLPFLPVQSAENFGEQPAVITPERHFSFNELLGIIQTAATALEKAGLHPGDRLAIEAQSTIEVIALFWAAIAGKISVALMSPRLPDQTFTELLQYLNCSIAYINSERTLHSGVHKLYWPPEARAGEHVNPFLPQSVNEEQPATIIFTSGSTGKPRAVLHAYRNHYYSALGSNQNIPLQPGDRYMLSLPLFHVAGIAILFRTMLAAASLVLPDKNSSLAENIICFKPTHLSLVAAQLSDLLNDPQVPPSLAGVKTILMGGSAMPQSLLQKAFARGWPLVVSYGSTEMSSQITATAPGAPFEDWQTSGRLLPYRELKISGSGEILVRGKTLFPGYLHGDKIQAKLTSDGWFATGDLGLLDAKDRLTVKGRKDRMFISGGENIYPEEIERALEQLPSVSRAVVVAVPHTRFGQRPVAFVQTAEIHDFDEAALKKALRNVLPGFKIPMRIFDWPKDAPSGMKVDLQWFGAKAADLVEKEEG